jgi:hypothetical protein
MESDGRRSSSPSEREPILMFRGYVMAFVNGWKRLVVQLVLGDELWW